MKRVAETDDPRRRLLIEALALGLLSAGLPGSKLLAADLLGNRPRTLPPGQSIYRLSGNCTVNGKEANKETRIGPSDTLHTGKDSEIIFVVGSSSMLLRGDSQVVLQSSNKGTAADTLTGMELQKGRLLSVYAPGSHQVRTATATIRITGTGMYIESDPERTYFCTCYGFARISANDDPQSQDTVASKHHDRPLYILAGNKSPGKSIQAAPFVNHTDDELAIIEALVGRTVPFAHSAYDRPDLPIYNN